MSRRTRIQDYEQISEATDLDMIVKDKRSAKRATKRKSKRRNRHYSKTMLRHLQSDVDRNGG